MKKYKNLEAGKKHAYESGEYLFVWLNELRATCKSDKSFQKQLVKLFEDASGVWEYWQDEKAKAELEK